MRVLLVVALVAALPLAACNTQTASVAPPAVTQTALAATPAALTGEARDKEWMKLAPNAVVDPKIARTIIDYPTREAPGTGIVVTKERRL